MPSFSRNLFAQCWSFLEESDALWRIYSTDKRGVLVTVYARNLMGMTKPKFEPPIEQLFLGVVQYHPAEKLKQKLESSEFVEGLISSKSYSADLPSVLLHKRDSFAHEKEVRIVLSRHISNETPEKYVPIDFPVSEIVVGITLDPRLCPDDYERQSYLIRSAGYAGKIAQSGLYKNPDLNLEIPNLMKLFESKKVD